MAYTQRVLRGSASNIVRHSVTALVGLVLPLILVRHLSQAEYSAWVLILQLSTYVSLLDLGLQNIVAKLIAEHDATGESEASHSVLSSSFTVLSIAAFLGSCVVLLTVWRVPHLFHQMPPSLLPEVRLSLLVIGLSSAFALPFSPFLSVFTGLQEYGFPTVTVVLSRLLAAIALIALTVFHAGLFHLALAIATVNVATAVAQFYGWKRYAKNRVAFSFFFLDRRAASRLLRSGGVIAIWSIGGLFVSGLDTVIVGHYDYGNTGFYAVGVTATNFMLLVVGSLFAPLLPAVSAMQVTSEPRQIGDLTVRASRYCALVLCLLALPLFLGAFPILTLWVGHEYALKSALFLQVLIAGNLIRQLGYPYTLVVIATGKQYLSTIAPVAEAIVNIIVSVWLVQEIGAVGVAIGTVCGALVSMGLHVGVSMRLTQSDIEFSRWKYIRQSILRPLCCVLPLLLLIPSWTPDSMLPAARSAIAIWIAATLLMMYFVGLTTCDRQIVNSRLKQFLSAGTEQR